LGFQGYHIGECKGVGTIFYLRHVHIKVSLSNATGSSAD
jgi:hypothetical protein